MERYIDGLKIYVASLSDYNAGNLHGAWIDLDGKSVEEVEEEIAAILRTSKHPNVLVECQTCEGDGLAPLDSPSSPDVPCETCNGTGTVPSAEEWAIHDYDGIPSYFGEHPNLADLIEYVEMVEEHGDAWVAYMDDQRHNDPSERDFSDRYAGSADSELDWIEQHLDDTGVLSEVPEHLRPYFDAEAYLRDMKAGGDVSFETVNGTVYAFWNR